MSTTARMLAIAALALIAAAIVSTSAGARDRPSCFGHRATIVGINGDDHLQGTDANDVIVGKGEGHDRPPPPRHRLRLRRRRQRQRQGQGVRRRPGQRGPRIRRVRGRARPRRPGEALRADQVDPSRGAARSGERTAAV